MPANVNVAAAEAGRVTQKILDAMVKDHTQDAQGIYKVQLLLFTAVSAICTIGLTLMFRLWPAHLFCTETFGRNFIIQARLISSLTGFVGVVVHLLMVKLQSPLEELEIYIQGLRRVMLGQPFAAEENVIREPRSSLARILKICVQVITAFTFILLAIAHDYCDAKKRKQRIVTAAVLSLVSVVFVVSAAPLCQLLLQLLRSMKNWLWSAVEWLWVHGKSLIKLLLALRAKPTQRQHGAVSDAEEC